MSGVGENPAGTGTRPMPAQRIHNLKCSFCGSRGRRLIAGPGVFICNECIELAYEISMEWAAEDVAEVEARRAAVRAVSVVEPGQENPK